ncbi:DUF5988 family protein [Streptomyces sp. NPDC005963]|uniref:DUF5988 family protein n=1 Tax=Streptomyces sp. NPDC005963 TaxID=3156721 RepID=UPI0033EDA00B
MEDTYENRPNAILTGGPAELLPEGERIRYVVDETATVKVLKGNRYEHWEPSPQTVLHTGGELRVYRWVRFTYVAE